MGGEESDTMSVPSQTSQNLPELPQTPKASRILQKIQLYNVSRERTQTLDGNEEIKESHRFVTFQFYMNTLLSYYTGYLFSLVVVKASESYQACFNTLVPFVIDIVNIQSTRINIR